MDWEWLRKWGRLLSGIFAALGGLSTLADLVGVILDFFKKDDDEC